MKGQEELNRNTNTYIHETISHISIIKTYATEDISNKKHILFSTNQLNFIFKQTLVYGINLLIISNIPAFTTIEKVPHLTAWIFAAMGISTIVGGLLAGLVSKRTSSLRAMRRTYLAWFLVSIPIAFTHPGWTMIIASALLGFVGGAIQVFYWEVMEAIRPKGSPTAMMGWLWTVEGTLMSIGSAFGGVISEKLSPTIALSITTACIGIGYVILALGKARLIAADRIPTDAEDLAAMKDNAPTTT